MKGQYEAGVRHRAAAAGVSGIQARSGRTCTDADRIALAQQALCRRPAIPRSIRWTWSSTFRPEIRKCSQVFEAMAAMWRLHLGANVRLAGEDWKVHMQNRDIGKPRMFWWAWIADYPDPLTFLALPMDKQRPELWALPQCAVQRADDGGNGHCESRCSAMRTTMPRSRFSMTDAVAIPIYYYRTRHLLRNYRARLGGQSHGQPPVARPVPGNAGVSASACGASCCPGC